MVNVPSLSNKISSSCRLTNSVGVNNEFLSKSKISKSSIAFLTNSAFSSSLAFSSKILSAALLAWFATASISFFLAYENSYRKI